MPPLIIQVVDTASVDVKLKSIPYNSATDKVVALNDPNHTEDLIVIEKVEIVMFSKISNVVTNVGATAPADLPVYHRLVVSQPTATGVGINDGTSSLVLDGGLVPDVGNSLIDTINLAPETALIATNRKVFDATGYTNTVGSAPTAMDTDGVRYRRLGFVHRGASTLTLRFKFELQYQEDPMNTGVGSNEPLGRQFTYANWTTFEQQVDQDITVQDVGSNFYNVHITYLDDDTLPMTGQFGRIYGKNSSMGAVLTWDTVGGETLTLSAVTQGVPFENAPYTGYPASVASLLLGAGGDTGTIDYVIVLNDETAGDGIVTATLVDDLETVTVAAYTPINIASHLVNGIRQILGVWTPGTVLDPLTLKVVRGRETRIYTDLFYSYDVHFSSYDLNDTDNDVTGVGSELEIPCNNGYLDFDAGGTRVGINIDSSRGGVVYLILLIGAGSTGVTFDGLKVMPTIPTTKLMGTANANFLDRSNYNGAATNPITDL